MSHKTVRVHFGGLAGCFYATSSRTFLPVVLSLSRASEHYSPHLDKRHFIFKLSSKIATKTEHPNRIDKNRKR
jgi:hypothetical protein